MKFLFDYVSPYAYLAWTQLHALGARVGASVEPVPILFAALLDAHGTRGPAEIPARRTYLVDDTLRSARRLGVPFTPPPAHPFNPLLALRVSTIAPERALIDALFAATWAGGGGVTDPSRVAAIARDCGLDGDALVAAASSQAAKDRLRAATGDAIDAGVFGVPTVIADGELFWGLDSLANLEAHLRGELAIDPSARAAWAALPSGATRKSS